MNRNACIAVPDQNAENDYYIVSRHKGVDELSGDYSGQFYSGVVRLYTDEGWIGSGVLLSDKEHILTAAHLVSLENGKVVSPFSIKVRFPFDQATHFVKDVHKYEGYDSVSLSGDLAVLELSSPAPEEAGYGLYQKGDEVGHDFTLAGYGVAGNGFSGTVSDSCFTLRVGQNTYDGDSVDYNEHTKWNIGSDQLGFDFDSGSISQDATDYYFNHTDLGLADEECLITSGDSGGPSFIQGQIAGIHSFVMGGTATDVNQDVDSSFGEVAFDTMVSPYIDWITSSVGKPTIEESFCPDLQEGDSGEEVGQVSVGLSDPALATVSVDYFTQSGTAKAGVDFKQTEGTLSFAAGQEEQVLEIAICGDNDLELNESFSLCFDNPQGALLESSSYNLTIEDDDYSGLAVLSGLVPEGSTFADVVFSNSQNMWLKIFDQQTGQYYTDQDVSQSQDWIRAQDLDQLELPYDQNKFYLRSWDSDQGLNNWQDFQVSIGDSKTGLWSTLYECSAGQTVALSHLTETEGLSDQDWIKFFDPSSLDDSGHFQGAEDGGYLETEENGWLRLGDLDQEAWVAGNQAAQEKIWFKVWTLDLGSLGWEDFIVKTENEASADQEVALMGTSGLDFGQDPGLL